MIDRPALDALLADADPAELFAIAGELQGRAFAAVTATKKADPPAPPARFIAPDQAATIAGVPAKRVYDWARNQRWAHRPTRRCLRIDEAAFRNWLASR
jgi:hypothetical protein